MAFKLLCCFKRFTAVNLPEIPKDLQRLLVSYCMRPPYLFYDEQETVNVLLFQKLDAVKKALDAEDQFERTPGDLELRYWPEDRSKILDPTRVHQFVQPIIRSITQVVQLQSFIYSPQKLTVTQLPSVEL